MFDLNTIITQALNAAVAEAVKPLVNRIDELENLLVNRITALENNPAIGTDTVLAERITALETAPNAISAAAFVTYLDQQEWFWEKLRGVADAAAEQVMEDHTSSYDHDEYDSVYNEWGSEESCDFVKDDDFSDRIRECVNDALNNATFSISI
jgi:hypothetical protein